MIATNNLQKLAKAHVITQAKRLGIDVGNKSKEQLIKAIERHSKTGGAKVLKSAGANSSKAKKSPKGKAPIKTTKKPVAKGKSNSQPSAASPKSASKKASLASSRAGVNAPVPVKTSAAKNQKGTASKSKKPVTATKFSTADKKPAVKKLFDKKPVAKKADGRDTSPASNKPQVKSEAAKKIPGKAIASPKTPIKAAAHKPELKESVTPPRPKTNPQVLKRIRELQSQRDSHKDIGYRPSRIQPPGANDPVWDKEPQKDRCGLFVRDPYWLHVTWDITRGAVERAQAVLAEQWHGAKPILRLMKIDDVSQGSAAETVQADIEIRGGVRNWYIPWTGESSIFRVSIGYIGSNGRFQAIAISNTVKTPSASHQTIDSHWTDLGPEGEKILSMSGGYDSAHISGELREILEDRLNRSLGAPALAKLASAADGAYRPRGGFHFDMDVELVLYGATQPDSYLTVNEQPVALRQDGSFVVRLPFPDRRQVIPAVAVARDGSHQRTIVVAVERNTKTMQPLEQEQDTGD